MEEQILFTPASLLDLLCQVDEFAEFEIGVVTGIDGDLILNVGDSQYKIEPDRPLNLEVEPEVAEDVAEQNMSAYEDLVDKYDGVASSDDQEVIESGIYTDTLKNMLVGGLVRMAGKYLKENFGND